MRPKRPPKKKTWFRPKHLRRGRKPIKHAPNDAARRLTEIGTLLFGKDNWKTPFAAALGYNRQSVYYWLGGQRPIPQRVLDVAEDMLLRSPWSELDPETPAFIHGLGGWLVHTRSPRFICRVTHGVDARDWDSFDGLVMEQDGTALHNFQWLDVCPHLESEAFDSLVESAFRAIGAA